MFVRDKHSSLPKTKKLKNIYSSGQSFLAFIFMARRLYFQPNLIFGTKAGAYPNETLFCSLFHGRLAEMACREKTL
jgi:hypothetical protein